MLGLSGFRLLTVSDAYGTAFAVLGGTLRPGIVLIRDLLEIDAHLRGVDVVVVGKGGFDDQTCTTRPGGCGAGRYAGRSAGGGGLGRRTLSDDRLGEAGIDAAYALTDLEADPAVCMTDATSLLGRIGARAASREV